MNHSSASTRQIKKKSFLRSLNEVGQYGLDDVLRFESFIDNAFWVSMHNIKGLAFTGLASAIVRLADTVSDRVWRTQLAYYNQKIEDLEVKLTDPKMNHSVIDVQIKQYQRAMERLINLPFQARSAREDANLLRSYLSDFMLNDNAILVAKAFVTAFDDGPYPLEGSLVLPQFDREGKERLREIFRKHALLFNVYHNFRREPRGILFGDYLNLRRMIEEPIQPQFDELSFIQQPAFMGIDWSRPTFVGTIPPREDLLIEPEPEPIPMPQFAQVEWDPAYLQLPNRPTPQPDPTVLTPDHGHISDTWVLLSEGIHNMHNGETKRWSREERYKRIEEALLHRTGGICSPKTP